jgi:catechol-2,3-dioxygenase
MGSPRLAHLRLDVSDLSRVVPFYTSVFDLDLHEQVGDGEGEYAFLSDGEMHHRLVLRQSAGASAHALPEATRLDHFAFEVDGPRELLRIVEALERDGVEMSLEDAGIAWQVYFRDPEGNRLEVCCDRRHAPGGRPFWEGRQERLDRSHLSEAAASGD